VNGKLEECYLVEAASGCGADGERKANLRIRKMLSFSTVEKIIQHDRSNCEKLRVPASGVKAHNLRNVVELID
jgi:hypothetical protein